LGSRAIRSNSIDLSSSTSDMESYQLTKSQGSSQSQSYSHEGGEPIPAELNNSVKKSASTPGSVTSQVPESENTELKISSEEIVGYFILSKIHSI
jgi:hypothetical protein